MEKINGKWMHDGEEYEIVEGRCVECPFVGMLDSCKLNPRKCSEDLGHGKRFKLKEKNMIKPFKCAAMTPDRVVKMKQALVKRVKNVIVFPSIVDADAFFVGFNLWKEFFYNTDKAIEEFLLWDYEEMTFDQAMEMILAAPVLVPAPKFEFRPFDQILRQNKHSETWKIGFYSHIEPNNFIGLNQATVMRMLPYKGNEGLLNIKARPTGWWEVENGKPVWRVE